MNEERNELNIFEKQIEWGVKPYLEKNDFNMVKKYCDDFKNEDIKVRIFNSDKKLIASSKGYSDEELIAKDSDILKDRKGILKTYKHSIRDKMIGVVKEISINNTNYYLEITISEEDVMESIIKAQSSIWYFLAACLIFLISGFIYVLQKIRIPFNNLQDNITKIANGNLETEIEVPDIDVLQELATSVKKMTQRLKLQIKRLKQLEDYKTEFIQNASHEIKTPITAINSAVELIESKKPLKTEQDKECFNIIKYQVRLINNLVNNILSLAEIETEKSSEHKDFKTINLNKTITKLIDYTSDIKINFITDKNIEIFGDEMLISHAISNLVTNAKRYSQTDKIDIILDEDANNATIAVKDYGIGIDKQHLDRLFERFYRVNKDRSRKTGRTGLGLAIVKNIAELHSGNVTVESEKGKGCTFTISIPKNKPEE